MAYDYVIVGSGLTGAVMARDLTDAGQRVLILERRSHLGGNVSDHAHPSGIQVHTYGPHYFRTNDEDLWAFVNRFAEFYQYEPALKSLVDGRYENWPIAGSYIQKTIGNSWEPEFKGEPKNFEEASLSMMPKIVYEKFVRGYSEKQWGVKATELSANLAKRFDVRLDDEPRLMRHTHQGIPRLGYSDMMKNMLKGIPIILNFDYLQNKDEFKPRKKLIFTGPIDEYFGFDLGKLKYRGQKRVETYYEDADYVQPCGQVNNPSPDSGAHIRSLEWKHMMQEPFRANIKGTLVTQEITYTPDNPSDYEYPFPDQANSDLYEKYRARADKLSNVLICGRLGEYRYFDMDQAIARARLLARRLNTSHFS
jgi:UDP-galactopyranose mutase